MVKVIAHRGWWTTPAEQNTLLAFSRAFDAGLGVELDVRDQYGILVVSHDPPEDDEKYCLNFQDALDVLDGRDLPLAVNVKSCGLAPWFDALPVKPKNWYFFDVASGDDVEYRKLRLPLYERDRWDAEPVLLVSHEVEYGIDPANQWAHLKDRHTFNVHLITDRVQEATEFFK